MWIIGSHFTEQKCMLQLTFDHEISNKSAVWPVYVQNGEVAKTASSIFADDTGSLTSSEFPTRDKSAEERF